MLLPELKREIQPLTKQEKAELMHFLIDLLSQEPTEGDLSQYFKPGEKHGFWSVSDEFRAAEQLQALLKQHQQ